MSSTANSALFKAAQGWPNNQTASKYQLVTPVAFHYFDLINLYNCSTNLEYMHIHLHIAQSEDHAIVNKFSVVVGVSEGTHNNHIGSRRSNELTCLMGQSSWSVAQGIFRCLLRLCYDSFVLFITDSPFEISAIKEFVFANKLPLVTTFSKESATMVFESPIKKQVNTILLG